MNRQELDNFLKIKRIPDYYYNLDGVGETDQRVCLEFDGREWLVFFSERGKHFDLKEFATENEACLNVINRLTTRQDQYPFFVQLKDKRELNNIIEAAGRRFTMLTDRMLEQIMIA